MIGILAITGFSGCGQKKAAEEIQTEDTTVEQTVREPVQEPYVYRSMDYGFELTFPISWGQISINNEAADNIVIASEDGKKELKLSVTPGDDAASETDEPLTMIGETTKYTVYRKGNFDEKFEEELKKISETFRAIDEDGNAVGEELRRYTNDEIGFKFEYPTKYDIKIYDEEEGIFRIHMGKYDEQKDSFIPGILFTIERADYFALLLEKEQAGFTLRNACDEADLVEYVKDCTEMKEGITSYLEVTKMGDVGFQKTYFIKTPSEEWPSAAFALNLFTEEDYEMYEDPGKAMLNAPLSDSQKKRIETMDAIVESLTFN